MGFERDVFYEQRGRAVHRTWQQNFEDHESRLTRAWRRVIKAGALIESYLLKDGRIPGPLRGVVAREQSLVASRLGAAGTIDFRNGVRVWLRLDADTPLHLILPLDPGEAMHCTLGLEQPATGSVHAVTSWSSNVYFRGGTAPDLSGNSLGQWDIVAAYCRGANGTMSFVHSGPFGPVP